MITKNDVAIMLNNLSAATEVEFANLIFNFVKSGTIDQDRFRDVIVGALAKEREACAQVAA